MRKDERFATKEAIFNERRPEHLEEEVNCKQSRLNLSRKTVRRAGSLPAASCRFHLTVDTHPFPVRLAVPAIGSAGTFTPKLSVRHHSGSDSASQGTTRHAWRITEPLCFVGRRAHKCVKYFATKTL
jgi:hypothetical protein